MIMRYLTKEWYTKMQYTGLHLGLKVNKNAEEFSEKFYEELYNKTKDKYIKDLSEFTDYEKFKKMFLESMDDSSSLKEEDIKTEFKNVNEDMFQGMSIEETFDNNQHNIIERFKKVIPKNILNKVKDIRVLGLGYVSSEVYKLLKEYCDSNDKFVEDRFKELEKVEKEQFKNDSIDFPKISFHDCFILDVIKEKNDLIIKLDNEYGFTDKSSITFKNHNIILDENIKESNWLYNEVYKNKDGYEVHILTSVNDDLKELILECEDIIVK